MFTVIMYLAESRVQPDFGFWDAFIWPYEKYVDDPAEVCEAPVDDDVKDFKETGFGYNNK